MKTLKLFLLSFLFVFTAQLVSGQSLKKETFKVNGECGMCKKKIENAAKNAGARYAAWDEDSKQLTVKYKSNAANTAKIQQAVADAGYDTEDIKASEDAYNKLDDCCKYERATTVTCKDEACMKDNGACCAEGKCTKDMSCTKEGMNKDCCKKG